MHGLLLDLRYGEFRLLVVREVRGDSEAAEEVEEVKVITAECALLPTVVDKRGEVDDELGTIDAQVIGEDAICDSETGSIGDEASSRVRLSPIEVSSLVGIDLRLFIEAERVLITAAVTSSTLLAATAAGSTASAFGRIENCDMLEDVVEIKLALRSLKSAMETIVSGLPPVVTCTPGDADIWRLVAAATAAKASAGLGEGLRGDTPRDDWPLLLLKFSLLSRVTFSLLSSFMSTMSGTIVISSWLFPLEPLLRLAASSFAALAAATASDDSAAAAAECSMWPSDCSIAFSSLEFLK